ncbi:MAG: DUF2924 domain-containing protein [Planctomycetota bacterium]
MARIDAQLAALTIMSPIELQTEWARVYDTPAPRLSPDLLRRGIGYRLQEKAGQPLTASALRQLRPRGVADHAAARPTVTLRAGAQLVRTWHGRTISVSVEDDGFLFEGRRYSSLTSIAREVTGAAWSGPRFFGLTGKAAS